MHEFFTRGLSMMLVSAILVVALPLIFQLLVTLGPVGFVVALFAFFIVGTAVTK